MDIRSYIESKDSEFYLEAERESFRASYPDIAITEYLEEYFLSAVTHKYGHERFHAFTLVEKGNPVGMIVVSIRDKFSLPACYVHNIYIRSSYRGNAGSKLLFESVELLCKEFGVNTIQLDVSVQNETALSIYRKLGFSAIRHTMEKRI